MSELKIMCIPKLTVMGYAAKQRAKSILYTGITI